MATFALRANVPRGDFYYSSEMPSPVGHALAGAAAGWLVAGRTVSVGRPGRPWIREAALFGSIGMLPDIDLFVGVHSGPTHGIGAAVIVGAAALLLSGSRSWRAAVRLGAACMLAYASHILLDWMGTDSSPPIGVMALWPFSLEYYESGLHVFNAVSRRYWQPETFWVPNFLALLRELAILVPVVLLVAFTRRRPVIGPRSSVRPGR